MVADIDMQFADNATDITNDVVISQLPRSGQMGNLTYNPSTVTVSGAFISHRISTMDGQRKSVNTPAGKGAFKSVKFPNLKVIFLKTDRNKERKLVRAIVA